MITPAVAAWLALAVCAVAAIALAAPSVSRCLSRVRQVAGTAAVSPQREGAAAGGMAVPASYVIEREPYDNGCLLVGEEADTS